MLWTSWSTWALASVYYFAVCDAQSTDNLGDAPSAEDFMRRIWARATVVGNFLYIDGGRLYQSRGGQRESNPVYKTVTNTLSIDLSRSWKPSNVEIRQIPKTAPKIERQVMLTDNESKAFYLWGGLVSGGSSGRSLWKFSADGTGSGSWSNVTLSGSDPSLAGSHGGASASTPDAGFLFGGLLETTQVASSDAFRREFLRLNFSQPETLVPRRSTAFSRTGTLYSASAEFAPNIGPNGMMVILGGNEYNRTAEYDTSNVDMETVRFMDPVTEKWYVQRTSGKAPEPRRWHCTVGVQSPNNTFEIDDISFDDVHILSLPGFVWRKAAYEPRDENRRTFMACVGAGKRQMIVVGGMAATGRSSEQDNSKDIFPQGLGIFDLTRLVWKDEYDAAADEYDSPDMVKSWYNEGGLETVTYNEDVASLLGLSTVEAKKSHPGMIAGAVVGGVLGVLSMLFIVFFVVKYRRRRSRNSPDIVNGEDAAPFELHGMSKAQLAGRDAQCPAAELDSQPAYAELDGRQWRDPDNVKYRMAP